MINTIFQTLYIIIDYLKGVQFIYFVSIVNNCIIFRYGRYNTVRQLLNSEKGTFIINESDGEGLTPLHIASQQGLFESIFIQRIHLNNILVYLIDKVRKFYLNLCSPSTHPFRKVHGAGGKEQFRRE